jgi:hypothetical protein
MSEAGCGRRRLLWGVGCAVLLPLWLQGGNPLTFLYTTPTQVDYTTHSTSLSNSPAQVEDATHSTANAPCAPLSPPKEVPSQDQAPPFPPALPPLSPHPSNTPPLEYESPAGRLYIPWSGWEGEECLEGGQTEGFCSQEGDCPFVIAHNCSMFGEGR